jgi:hypothetical protein
VPSRPSLACAPLLLGATLLLSSCSRDEVTHFRVAKAAPAGGGGVGTAPAHQRPAPPPGMAGDVAPPPAPDHGLRWTLPKGWTEERGSGGMRYATLKAPVGGTIDASVVVLSGQAGGELMNVNRWRGQISLEAIDEAQLAAARKAVASKAGPLKVYDFTSQAKGKRLVAGILEAGDSTWFVKVTGDAAAVTAAHADFLSLLGSLRLE